jgi:hypothetical protein
MLPSRLKGSDISLVRSYIKPLKLNPCPMDLKFFDYESTVFPDFYTIIVVSGFGVDYVSSSDERVVMNNPEEGSTDLQ